MVTTLTGSLPVLSGHGVCVLSASCSAPHYNIPDGSREQCRGRAPLDCPQRLVSRDADGPPRPPRAARGFEVPLIRDLICSVCRQQPLDESPAKTGT